MSLVDEGGQWLDLADAVELLRDQVAQARARVADPAGGGDRGVRFELGEITVELGMELTDAVGKEGGLRFAVMGLGVKAGGKVESSEVSSHKLTVRLIPHGVDGGPVEVRDRG